jgi:hypothetical protein
MKPYSQKFSKQYIRAYTRNVSPTTGLHFYITEHVSSCGSSAFLTDHVEFPHIRICTNSIPSSLSNSHVQLRVWGSVRIISLKTNDSLSLAFSLLIVGSRTAISLLPLRIFCVHLSFLQKGDLQRGGDQRRRE